MSCAWLTRCSTLLPYTLLYPVMSSTVSCPVPCHVLSTPFYAIYLLALFNTSVTLVNTTSVTHTHTHVFVCMIYIYIYIYVYIYKIYIYIYICIYMYILCIYTSDSYMDRCIQRSVSVCMYHVWVCVCAMCEFAYVPEVLKLTFFNTSATYKHTHFFLRVYLCKYDLYTYIHT